MGEGTDRVKASPEELQREVETLRDEIDPVLKELGHRKHELTDMGRQVKRYTPAVVKSAVAAAGLLAFVAYIRSRRAKRGHRSLA